MFKSLVNLSPAPLGSFPVTVYKVLTKSPAKPEAIMPTDVPVLIAPSITFEPVPNK